METAETPARERLDSTGTHSVLSQLIVVSPRQGEQDDQMEGAVFSSSMLDENG